MGFGEILARCLELSQPNMSPKGAGILILLYGAIMIGCGFWLVGIDSDITEYRVQYKFADGTSAKPKIEFKEQMKGPVYMFLELENFYQNHRSMARSLSRLQLEDQDDPKIESKCSGAYTVANFSRKLTKKGTNVPISPDAIANPCGFMAKNFPLDTFISLKEVGGSGKEYLVGDRKENMLMKGDQKFKAAKDQDKNPQWIEVTNNRFENWMKTSSSSTFMNLWGVIESDIPKGTYEISINNLYDETNYGGKKNIVFSNSNAIGGKNPVTYKAFFTVGFLLFIFGGLLILLSFRREELRFLKQTGSSDSRERGISHMSML